MKKLSILFAAGVLFFGGVAYAGYSEPSFTAQKINNSQENQKEPYREIKLVRFGTRGANVAALVSGDAVVYSDVSADGVTVNKSVNSADGAFAGIVCTTIPSSDAATAASGFADEAGRGNWGYIVTRGPAFATTGAGGTNGNAYGDFFITSSDSGKITTMGTQAQVAATRLDVAINVRGKGGFFMQSADGTSTTYKVYVNAP